MIDWCPGGALGAPTGSVSPPPAPSSPKGALSPLAEQPSEGKADNESPSHPSACCTTHFAFVNVAACFNPHHVVIERSVVCLCCCLVVCGALRCESFQFYRIAPHLSVNQTRLAMQTLFGLVLFINPSRRTVKLERMVRFTLLSL